MATTTKTRSKYYNTMLKSPCMLDTLRLKPEPWQMGRGQAMQEQRVRNDEQREADAKYVFDDRKDMYRAHWNEELEEASFEKRLKYMKVEMKTELSLCNKTLTELRRAQLEHLLNFEDKKYKDELNSLGLTVFKERL